MVQLCFLLLCICRIDNSGRDVGVCVGVVVVGGNECEE